MLSTPLGAAIFAKKNMTKKAEQMYELVQDWRKSGQSKTVYCQEVSINIHTFTYWVQKYKEKMEGKIVEQKASKFIPLAVKNPPSFASSGIELNYPNGVRLCVTGQPDLELLRGLIKVSV
jgi:hypothetical protein